MNPGVVSRATLVMSTLVSIILMGSPAATASEGHPADRPDVHLVVPAFHGCEGNGGQCDNSPTVIVCVQPDSCHFREERRAK